MEKRFTRSLGNNLYKKPICYMENSYTSSYSAVRWVWMVQIW